MRAAVWAVFVCAVCAAQARTVSLETAELAARAWAVRGETLGAPMGDRIEKGTAQTTDTGATFYTVKVKGGGTIVLTSDDELEPILAFADGDADWTALSHDSPMWALLNRHVSGMNERLRGLRGGGSLRSLSTSTVQPSTSNLQPSTASQKRWAALIAEGEEIERNGLPKMGTRKGDDDIGDMRVPALCKTKWSQEGGVYNYYTPKNYPCGCVATAQSQIMRKHGWPTNCVKKVTQACWVGDDKVDLTTQGGYFDWANMVYSGASREVEKQAIGKLTSDVGITLGSSYNSGGTGATTSSVSYSLRNNFGYGSAIFVESCGAFSTNCTKRAEALSRIFFSNFDAGLPVCIGLSDHEIVADGYGYIETVDYVHFNFGWSGSYNAWYHIPDLTDAGKSYYYIDDLVYNIMPTNTTSDGIISGRVLDEAGRPIAGARVEVKVKGGSEVAAAATSSDYGVWAVTVPGGSSSPKSYTVSVGAFGNYKAGSLSGVKMYAPNGTYLSCDPGDDLEDLGNSWGNDITLETANPDYPEVPNTGATFEHHAVGDTRVIDEDDFGGIAKETYLGKFWWGPDAFANVKCKMENEECRGNYASLTGLVYRAIHNTYDVTNTPAALPADFAPEALGGSNFVFDAWVRLQDTQDISLPNGDAKIAVAVQGGKLVVIAGDGVNDHSTKVYETGVRVDASVMHRVTIRANTLLSTPTPTTYTFSVWLDRRRVPGIFPSRILAGEDAGRLRAMGFLGADVSVDDVFFSRELPFALPGMMFLVR